MDGREGRSVRNENTRNATGWCVEAQYLASKLVAFRDKDRDFVVLILENLIKLSELLQAPPTSGPPAGDGTITE
jgi:hypothetical protein